MGGSGSGEIEEAEYLDAMCHTLQMSDSTATNQ